MNKLPEILGESEAVLEMMQHVNRVSKVDRPVLVIGERGTGKELVASRLHYMSPRWEMGLNTFNCASFTENLVDLELFGNEVGAFTGAVGRRAGRIEVADEGTLFLDEIGLLPMNVQEKLLRVIEYGVFNKVGGTEEISVDVRVVAATNADLIKMVENGEFKADLLDRLSFEIIHVPPLRERGDDCLILARYFLNRMSVELSLPNVPIIGPKVENMLLDYPWPGNIRELKNVVERALLRSPEKLEDGIDFTPFEVKKSSVLNDSLPHAKEDVNPNENEKVDSFKERVAQFECGLLQKALHDSGGHRGQAAEKLGLTYHQIRALMRKYQNQKSLAKWN